MVNSIINIIFNYIRVKFSQKNSLLTTRISFAVKEQMYSFK